MDEKHIGGLQRQTDNPYLNLYEVDAIGRAGQHFPYYVATRREEGDLMCQTGELRADGVVVYAVCKETQYRIVLVRQYRYAVGTYLYELPAGLVDPGEDAETAAVREMKEETGYTLIPHRDYDNAWRRPFVQSQGMSDECDSTIFGTVEPEVGQRALEDTEEIEVVLADKEEVRRIIREEIVTIRAAYLLMQFLQSDPENPFAFLDF